MEATTIDRSFIKIGDTFLTAENLVVGYTGKNNNNLFEELDLRLIPGELVCFMGPNGVGKSTLLRTLGGFQPPLSGTIKVKAGSVEKRITDHSVPELISVVLTDKVAHANLTVKELITFGRYPYLDWKIKLTKQDQEIIEKSLSQVHIGHLADTKIYQLSDGQLQMTMIARALAQETPILLLDEPTAHLDLNNRVEIMDLLRNLSRLEGKAILVATHELDLALQTADLIWLAGKEKNILKGIPEDLVLNGAFDSIFQFKGFDLKTGKVQHEAWRGVSVNLIGEGPEYLWTKNALERCGYKLSDAFDAEITVRKNDNQTVWIADGVSFLNLKDVLNSLAPRLKL